VLAPPLTTAACLFLRVHERPCPLCAAVQADTSVIAAPEMWPSHPGHFALALAVDRAHTVQRYAGRGLHLFESELDELTPADRIRLDLWVAGTDALPADLRARAHTVGQAGAHGVRCTRCGVVLDDAPTHYAPGTYVGLDCEGAAGGTQ
jgi:hypothetical protein